MRDSELGPKLKTAARSILLGADHARARCYVVLLYRDGACAYLAQLDLLLRAKNEENVRERRQG